MEPVTPDRTLPVKLKVAQPVCRLDKRWSLPAHGVGDTHPIGRSAEADLLFEGHYASKNLKYSQQSYAQN
jgi:hypothetical protein